MAVDSIVRVSFQTNPSANQAVNQALVGHAQDPTGSGPFTRVGTAAYTCRGGAEVAVMSALDQLGRALSKFAVDVDFVSITVAAHRI